MKLLLVWHVKYNMNFTSTRCFYKYFSIFTLLRLKCFDIAAAIIESWGDCGYACNDGLLRRHERPHMFAQGIGGVRSSREAAGAKRSPGEPGGAQPHAPEKIPLAGGLRELRSRSFPARGIVFTGISCIILYKQRRTPL
jgi:hypothetical protein